jgi:hypothetical protein
VCVRAHVHFLPCLDLHPRSVNNTTRARFIIDLSKSHFNSNLESENLTWTTLFYCRNLRANTFTTAGSIF